MADEGKYDEMKLVEYRLGKIEETLVSFQKVLIETSRLGDRIAAIDEKLETHIKHSAGVLDNFNKRIETAEEQPLKSRADRWQYIVDYVFKGMIAVIAGWLFLRLGLK